ncbi:hypothetical protein [Natronorubrum sp. FCH18a]|uniref:hypothetical protein n=1 Tax=Natronorubrum sp. FCH18a TaxID=3447018 RepID=UPI003F518876
MPSDGFDWLETDNALTKGELQRIVCLLLDHHELEVGHTVDKTNIATLNNVGLRGAIAECCGFEYYDHEPWDHWAARTNTNHREGQEAFTVEELAHVRDELQWLVDLQAQTEEADHDD